MGTARAHQTQQLKLLPPPSSLPLPSLLPLPSSSLPNSPQSRSWPCPKCTHSFTFHKWEQHVLIKHNNSNSEHPIFLASENFDVVLEVLAIFIGDFRPLIKFLSTCTDGRNWLKHIPNFWRTCREISGIPVNSHVCFFCGKLYQDSENIFPDSCKFHRGDLVGTTFKCCAKYSGDPGCVFRRHLPVAYLNMSMEDREFQKTSDLVRAKKNNSRVAWTPESHGMVIERMRQVIMAIGTCEEKNLNFLAVDPVPDPSSQ